jgi:hypothetical protein
MNWNDCLGSPGDTSDRIRATHNWSTKFRIHKNRDRTQQMHCVRGGDPCPVWDKDFITGPHSMRH